MSFSRTSRIICAVAYATAFLCAATVSAQQSLATYHLGTGSATFGIVLPKGAATGGLKVGALATQTDVKSTWPDGSIKFAVVTCEVASEGDYAIVPSSASTGSFSPTLPSANVQITVGNTAYTSSLPATLTDPWLKGPLVAEGRAVTAFSPGPSGAAAHLRVIWDVRSYKSGGHRVSVTIDNTENVTEANAVVYSLAINVAGQTVYSRTATVTPGTSTLTQSGDSPAVIASHGLSEGDWVRVTGGPYAGQFRRVNQVLDSNRVVLNSGFNSSPTNVTWERVTFIHPYMARVRKTFSVAPLKEAAVTPDFSTYYQAKVVPAYLPTIKASARSTAGWKFDAFGIGDLTYPIAMVGDRDELGLFPAWVAQYLTFKTASLREYVLKMGDLAGTFSIHVSETDGQMLSLDKHGGFFTAIQGNGDSGPAGGGPETIGRGYYGEDGAAHQPSLAFVPYILTGDRYYLDELKFWANYGMLSWLWLRGDSQGLVTAQQIRGVGWALRDIAEAAAFTPDADPWKTYFTTRVMANLQDLDARAAQEKDPLGSAYSNLRIDEPGNIIPFMQSFLLWGLEHARALGFTSAGNSYRLRIATYFNTLQTASGFDWRAAASYYIRVVDGSNNFFKSYADMYTYNFGGSSPLYTSTPIVPNHYGVNLRIILMSAVDLGLPNAAANLSRLMAYSTDGYSMVDEVNSRQQYAITSSASNTASTASTPKAPTNVRVIR